MIVIYDTLGAYGGSHTLMLRMCQKSAKGKTEQAFSWGFEKYREQCFASFRKTKEVYDIDMCMEQLINADTKNKNSLLSSYESIRHFLNQKFNKIRFRQIDSFDFKNLKLEKNKVS